MRFQDHIFATVFFCMFFNASLMQGKILGAQFMAFHEGAWAKVGGAGEPWCCWLAENHDLGLSVAC